MSGLAHRQRLLHDQGLYAEAIGSELARLLERVLTEEESNLVADITVCQGFMSSEADANRLHFATDSAEAERYLEQIAIIVRERRAEVVEMIAKALPLHLRLTFPAKDYVNLIQWQSALIDAMR